eukprot:scaffold2874_cov110-Alexandrium_tamarense.AAC.19
MILQMTRGSTDSCVDFHVEVDFVCFPALLVLSYSILQKYFKCDQCYSWGLHELVTRGRGERAATSVKKGSDQHVIIQISVKDVNGRIFTLGVEPSANVGSLKRDVLAAIDIPYRSGQVVLGKMEEDSSNSCANVPICVKYSVHGEDSNI